MSVSYLAAAAAAKESVRRVTARDSQGAETDPAAWDAAVAAAAERALELAAIAGAVVAAWDGRHPGAAAAAADGGEGNDEGYAVVVAAVGTVGVVAVGLMALLGGAGLMGMADAAKHASLDAEVEGASRCSYHTHPCHCWRQRNRDSVLRLGVVAAAAAAFAGIVELELGNLHGLVGCHHCHRGRTYRPSACLSVGWRRGRS